MARLNCVIIQGIRPVDAILGTVPPTVTTNRIHSKDEHMLADDVKSSIQLAYRQLLDSRELTPRYGQRLMIAEIAKCLSVLATDGDCDLSPVCVV